MQERQVVATRRDTVDRGLGIPARGRGVVLTGLLAGGIQNAQLQAGRAAALTRRLAVPTACRARIARHAEAAELQRTEVIQRIGVTVRGGTQKPVRRGLEVLRQS